MSLISDYCRKCRWCNRPKHCTEFLDQVAWCSGFRRRIDWGFYLIASVWVVNITWWIYLIVSLVRSLLRQ